MITRDVFQFFFLDSLVLGYLCLYEPMSLIPRLGSAWGSERFTENTEIFHIYLFCGASIIGPFFFCMWIRSRFTANFKSHLRPLYSQLPALVTNFSRHKGSSTSFSNAQRLGMYLGKGWRSFWCIISSHFSVIASQTLPLGSSFRPPTSSCQKWLQVFAFIFSCWTFL